MVDADAENETMNGTVAKKAASPAALPVGDYSFAVPRLRAPSTPWASSADHPSGHTFSAFPIQHSALGPLPAVQRFDENLRLRRSATPHLPLKNKMNFAKRTPKTAFLTSKTPIAPEKRSQTNANEPTAELKG